MQSVSPSSQDHTAADRAGNFIRDQERPGYAISLIAGRTDSPWQTVYLFVTEL